MAKKLHVSFVLDETGSMDVVKKQTISGFNEYIANLKRDKSTKDVLFSLMKFNSGKIENVYTDTNLDWVSPLTEQNYMPDNLTPLYDAIGKAVAALESRLNGKKHQNVLFIVQTDGQENCSQEHTRESIFKLISQKREKGWTFAFLGADQDAWLASQQIGISRGNTFNYASHDTQSVVGRGMAAVTQSYATSVANGMSTENLVKDTDWENTYGADPNVVKPTTTASTNKSKKSATHKPTPEEDS